MKPRQRIAVIGAGLVGCLLARMLAQRGHDVSLFEKRPDPSIGPPSAGRSTHLVISARGWRALDIVGARSDVQSATLPLRGRRIHTSDQGQMFQPYGGSDHFIHAIHRRTINQILLDLCAATPGVTMHFQRKCVHADAKFGDIIVEDTATTERTQIHVDRIFAADGAFSSIRMQLLRHERFDYSQTYERFGYKEITIGADNARHLEQDAMHAWPRGSTSLFAFPNSDGSFTATLIAPFNGNRGFSSLKSSDDVVGLFDTQFQDLNPKPLVDEVLCNPISSLVTVRCSPWAFDNRLMLIGDAAHAMVPFLGQGMNAGFEDCTLISELLDQYDEDFELVFDYYESERRRHCDAVTDMSTRAFTELTERISDARFHLQKKLERKLHALYPERFIPPYELIAFTNVPYAEVLQRILQLDSVTRQFMDDPDLQALWDSPALDERIRAVLDRGMRATHAEVTEGLWG